MGHCDLSQSHSVSNTSCPLSPEFMSGHSEGSGRARQLLYYLRVTHGSLVNKKEARHKGIGGGLRITIAPAALLKIQKRS